jgi:hypothetical protein
MDEKLEVEDEGKKVIFPAFFLCEYEKIVKKWARYVTEKNPNFVMVLGKFHSLRCPSAYYAFLRCPAAKFPLILPSHFLLPEAGPVVSLTVLG